MHYTYLAVAIHILLEVAILLRVMLRPHREGASRIAWVVVILALPVAGIVGYLLFGEVRVDRRWAGRMRRVLQELPSTGAIACVGTPPERPAEFEPLFRVAESINGFAPVGGNRARLLDDTNSAVRSMIEDIDAAEHDVHLLFYIWLPDNNGRAMAEALMRAARRGVTCRALADGVGSRHLIRSPHWAAMREAGVRLGVALPLGNLLIHPLLARIDVRNHRKLLIVDGRVAYCGSQNCADPEFRIKPRFAPWVDLMVRFEGPVAWQCQHLFASDWMAHVDESLGELLGRPAPVCRDGFTAQALGTGPTVRFSAMPEMFESLIYFARRELVISTPYFVPDESMQGALCAAAWRGVETTLILPARNDSRFVAAASRSYYLGLLEAGVRIFEFHAGLLHAKSLTVDGQVTLIGSANMDRRSFHLNFENNVLCCDAAMTAAVRERQQAYLAQSHPVTLEMVAAWALPRRLWNNTLAMLGPVL